MSMEIKYVLSKFQIEPGFLYFIWQPYLQEDMTERSNEVNISKREQWYTCILPSFPLTCIYHLS